MATQAKMPSRAQQFTIFLLATTVLWFISYTNLNIFPPQVQFFFPLWFAVTTGAMALGNIGLHMITFRDCPEAFEELQQQIKVAKKDLAKKGLKL